LDHYMLDDLYLDRRQLYDTATRAHPPAAQGDKAKWASVEGVVNPTSDLIKGAGESFGALVTRLDVRLRAVGFDKRRRFVTSRVLAQTLIFSLQLLNANF